MRCNYDNYKLTRRCLAIFFLTSDSFIFLSEALIIEDWWSITHVIQSIAINYYHSQKLAIFNIRQTHDTFFDTLVSRIYVFRYWEKPLQKKKIFPDIHLTRDDVLLIEYWLPIYTFAQHLHSPNHNKYAILLFRTPGDIYARQSI